jgi:UDP:flavonoid glycosyltransferase YjiC (YdhE family)
VTAAQLRAALDAVLNDPGYRQHARQMGETLRTAGGYLRAVQEIETFVGMKATQSLRA